jgi:hypothetical protein
MRNRRLVPFDRAAFRFLVAPSQLVQELADMIAMILNAEPPLYRHGNSLSRPQFRTIAMCHGLL